MYQNYNYYPSNQVQGYNRTTTPYPNTTMPLQGQQSPLGLKGRPVASLDEARASSIDFDGSIFYFPDLANKKIYTKQINPDGTATLNVYELGAIPEPVTTSSSAENYVTKEELATVLSQFRESLAATTGIPEAAKAKETTILPF